MAAVGVLVMGLYSLYRSVYFLARGVKAQGIITEDIHLSARQARPRATYYLWRIEFSTPSGEKHSFNVSAGTSFILQPKIGDAIEVYYDPSDLAQAQLGTFYQMLFVPAVFTLAGLSLLVWMRPWNQ